jgi:hypothetical protein
MPMGKADQEAERIPIVCDGVRTGVALMHQPLREVGLQQFRHRREIPIRVANMNVAEIRAQLRQARLDICVGAIALQRTIRNRRRRPPPKVCRRSRDTGRRSDPPSLLYYYQLYPRARYLMCNRCCEATPEVRMVTDSG